MLWILNCGRPKLPAFFGTVTGGNTISELLINERIREPEVRVIGEDGAQLGIMSSREALKIAEEHELDLILIAPTAKPPVCRIMDYGRYRYEQVKKERDAKKKQKIVEVKEIRLSPNIDTNDLNTKSNNARKFLEKGNRVKVTLRFRGREMAHVNATKGVLDEFAGTLADISNVDKPAKMEGRSMSIVLAPKPGK
ncbi:MAG: translation initiation factor IF-3 [Lachnospiraceae bacterium]|nr:translation initiation factor IF-3 [Lachnospiraceae bacterium]